MTAKTRKPNKGSFKVGKPGGPGRPSTYTPELGEEICVHLARGESLRSACDRENFPTESTVRGWTLDPKHPFAAQYVRAREISYHRMAEELLVIADEGINDTQIDDEGKKIVNHDHIARSRLRVDTRKWILSKMLPKVYGDKITQEIGGPDGGPLEVTWLPPSGEKS